MSFRPNWGGKAIWDLFCRMNSSTFFVISDKEAPTFTIFGRRDVLICSPSSFAFSKFFSSSFEGCAIFNCFNKAFKFRSSFIYMSLGKNSLFLYTFIAVLVFGGSFVAYNTSNYIGGVRFTNSGFVGNPIKAIGSFNINDFQINSGNYVMPGYGFWIDYYEREVPLLFLGYLEREDLLYFRSLEDGRIILADLDRTKGDEFGYPARFYFGGRERTVRFNLENGVLYLEFRGG